MVKAHYTGRLMDGTVFDSSRGFLKQPFSFQIGAGDVIRGWDQASACSSHPLAGTAPAHCSAGMGITRTRVRSRPPALGAGHAEDEQGREGDSHMHARLRMYARAHRTKRGPPCTRPTHPCRDNACRYLARQTASAARRPTSRPARPWSSTSSSLASAESPSSEPAGQTAGAQPRARRTRTRVVWYGFTYRPIFFIIRRVCRMCRFSNTRRLQPSSTFERCAG